MKQRATIIYLTGKQGAGKYTIDKELREKDLLAAQESCLMSLWENK